MRNRVSRRTPAFSNFERWLGKSKSGVVILVALALAVVSPQFAFAQTTQQQQQEEQQREEQQREEQAREQQQRDEQAREEQQRQEQQREEQQREEQQREEQQREEQAREQQQRDEQAREEQQRQEQQHEEQQREEQERAQQAQAQQQQDQQQREQQAREQQQQDEQRREEPERQQQQPPATPGHSSDGASPSENSQVTRTIPAGSQVSNDTRPAASTLKPDGGSNAAAREPENAASKRQDLRPPASDPPHPPCDKVPCAEPGPKPQPPDSGAKLCKDGPCPVCAPGQSPGKDKSCVPAALVKEANAPPKPKPGVVPQSCVGGQVWNGVQCATVGPPQCSPGQAKVGSSCQPDCPLATAGAQNYIELLRMARQDRDNACTQNPTGDECRSEESTYNLRLNEYRSYIAGVPTECTLPDPISI